MLTPLLLTCLLAPPTTLPATAPSTAPATAPTTAPAVEPVSDELAALIAELGSPEFRARRAAMRALRERGTAARPALEQALEHPDTEVRALARTLLAEIADADRMGETRVTLKLDKVSAPEALAALEEAIGYTFKVEPENWTEFGDRGKVSVDLQDVPLLDAIRAVVPRCGLSIPEHGQGQLWAWGEQDWPDYPKVRAGAVQLEARSISINSNASINLGHEARQANTHGQISFMVLIEPKLRIVGTPAIVIEEVRDNNGNAIANEFQDHGYYYGESAASLFHFAGQALGLSMDDQATSIARMAGQVVLQVEQESDQFVIDNPMAAGASKTYLKTELTVEQMTKEDYGFAVRVEIVNPGQITSEMAFLNGLQLELTDGRTIRPSIQEHGEDGWNISGQLAYHLFNHNGEPDTTAKPARLVWHVPLKLEERKIPFEFKDLPLP